MVFFKKKPDVKVWQQRYVDLEGQRPGVNAKVMKLQQLAMEGQGNPPIEGGTVGASGHRPAIRSVRHNAGGVKQGTLGRRRGRR